MASKTPAPGKNKNSIVIDGTEYPLDDLSSEAKSQIVNLRVVDQELQRLQAQLAITQTARAAYARALKTELDKK